MNDFTPADWALAIVAVIALYVIAITAGAPA